MITVSSCRRSNVSVPLGGDGVTSCPESVGGSGHVIHPRGRPRVQGSHVLNVRKFHREKGGTQKSRVCRRKNPDDPSTFHTSQRGVERT